MKLDEYALAQLFAEFKEAQGQAMAILVQALCQQVDASRLKKDLDQFVLAAKTLPSTSALAVGMLIQAQAAAQAEASLQSKSPSEGPHPKREG